MSSRPVDLPAQHAPLVCVVDPDAAVRRSVTALLHAVGAHVEGYPTAREFLARLTSAVPVCLVAGTHLPDMSGIALLQDLRARGLSVPTILLADDGDVTLAVSAMRAGAVDFIEKPYIDRTLVAQVASILDVDGHRQH